MTRPLAGGRSSRRTRAARTARGLPAARQYATTGQPLPPARRDGVRSPSSVSPMAPGLAGNDRSPLPARHSQFYLRGLIRTIMRDGKRWQTTSHTQLQIADLRPNRIDYDTLRASTRDCRLFAVDLSSPLPWSILPGRHLRFRRQNRLAWPSSECACPAGRTPRLAEPAPRRPPARSVRPSGPPRPLFCRRAALTAAVFWPSAGYVAGSSGMFRDPRRRSPSRAPDCSLSTHAECRADSVEPGFPSSEIRASAYPTNVVAGRVLALME